MSIGKGIDEAILDYDWRCDGISGRSRSRQPAAQGLRLTTNFDMLTPSRLSG